MALLKCMHDGKTWLRIGTFTTYQCGITIVQSFIDLTSLDLKLLGDGAMTIISCGKRFHVLMVRGRKK